MRLRPSAGFAACLALLLVAAAGPTPSRSASTNPVNRLIFPWLRQDVNAQPCSIAPTLISPPDGSQLDTRAPLFQWNGNDPGALVLYVYIDTDPEFRNWTRIRPDDPRGFDQEYMPFNLDLGKRYYWRALTNCGLVSSPYSPTWSFTTPGAVGPLPDKPTLVAPDDGATVPTSGVVLRWNAVPGAVDYARYYQAELATNATEYNVVPDTQSALPTLSNLTYDWWVTARNQFGYGDQSEIRRFTATRTPASLILPPARARPPVVYERGTGPPPP